MAHARRLGAADAPQDTARNAETQADTRAHAISIDCFSLQSLAVCDALRRIMAITGDAIAPTPIDRVAQLSCARRRSRATRVTSARRSAERRNVAASTRQKKMCATRNFFQKNSAPEVRETKNRASRSQI